MNQFTTGDIVKDKEGYTGIIIGIGYSEGAVRIRYVDGECDYLAKYLTLIIDIETIKSLLALL